MHRMCKLIHTDLKPENVVISLTKEELKEIKKNGCLATTKAMRRNKNLKERAVAGANGEVLVSTRLASGMSRNLFTDGLVQHPSKDRMEAMESKDKKKYKKKKRKREKKYMKQGKLPEDYDKLPQTQKDMLYYTIRSEISGEEMPTTTGPSVSEESKNTRREPSGSKTYVSTEKTEGSAE